MIPAFLLAVRAGKAPLPREDVISTSSRRARAKDLAEVLAAAVDEK
jgi:hypothetical protein